MVGVSLFTLSALSSVLQTTSIVARIFHKTLQTAQPGGGRNRSSLTWAINCWSDEEITAWKAAYMTNCNSIAVASAIFASIGLSSLQLPDMNATHWTARAFLITSMSLGILSTVYATAQQAEVAMLIDPLDLRIYLSRGRSDLRSIKEHLGVSPTTDVLVDGTGGYDAKIEQQDDVGLAGDEPGNADPGISQQNEHPTFATLEISKLPNLLPIQGSVVMEVRAQLPQELLYLAVMTYMVGFGLYLLFLWLRNVGNDGSVHMSIFIFFIVVSSAFLFRILFMSLVQVLDGARRDSDFSGSPGTEWNNRAILTTWLGKLKDLKLVEENKSEVGRGSDQILQEIAVLVKEWEANSPVKRRAVGLDIVTDIYMLSMLRWPEQMMERFNHKATGSHA